MKLKEIIDALNGNTRRRARVRVAVGSSISALVGAAAGIMLAPKSGREIRKDMKHGVEWSADKARDAVSKSANFVKEEANLVNDTVTEKVNNLKTRLKHAK